MADKKVKIGNILDNLLPEFITTDNSLFVDFLKQYYISEERDYGSIYLIDNLANLKNVESFAELLIGALNPATGQPFLPITLSESVLHLDETIEVNTTVGFPEQYGLLRIENEIITYTGKTATSFTGCVRGFSSVSAIETSGNQEYLTFSKTDIDDHPKGTLVSNLNFLYLQEFYRKHKYQFLPGFEERQFQNVSIENILSRAKDFFSSKGTETALKILFNVLFAKQVEISRPFDQTIQPSSADWIKTDDIIVEAIEGNPKRLESTTLSQDSVSDPTASGAVASVDEVFLGSKKYFKISFAPEPSPRFGIGASPDRQFSISKKTKVLQATTGTTVVTVDSTMGFPESGSFYYYDGIRYNEVTYLSKNYNQFLDCDGIGLPLQPDTEITDIKFVYGFEGGDEDKPVTLRVVGTVSDIQGKNLTKYFKEGDTISLKSFGEKYKDDDVRFNKWFYNNVSFIDVETVNVSSNTFTTKTKHYINKFDKVDILLTSGAVVKEDVKIISTISDITVQCEALPIGTLSTGPEYVLRKRVGYSAPELGVESGMHNIQNSFTDDQGNCYVMFSGFPSYDDIEVPNRTVEIQTSEIDTTGTGEITINDHGFENGEVVYYNPAEDTEDTAGDVFPGTYVVKVVNSNTIKLALTHPAIESDIYVLFQRVGVSTHTISPIDLYSFKEDAVKPLKPQNNFKRFLKTPERQIENSVITGPIGVALNGVEFHSPVGVDRYNYGQIDDITVISPGSGYDVNFVPELSVNGGIGLTAFANCSGHIDGIDLITAGFDYVGIPVVKIQGGNSSGTILEAKMRGLTHNVSVNDFAVSLSANVITKAEHKFINGEAITYIASGTPIGITSANVGFATTRLSSGSTYYVHKVDNDTFSLTSTLNDAINGTKIIDFNAFGTEDHTFRSKLIRNVIDRIDIVDQGNKLSTRKVEIDSQSYPPEFAKDEFTTFTGINTHLDYIYAKNHGFSDGEVLAYKTTNNISGLNSDSVYKVKVLDQNKFKLAHAGTATTVSDTNYNNEIYVDLTDVGAGIHTIGYPEITISIDGVVSAAGTVIPSYFNATATPIITGGIDDVFIRNGGNSFGSSDLINYDKGLNTKLLTGKDAALKPLINSNGEIETVFILDGGSEYTSPPKLKIEGDGSFAELKATVTNGKITAVTIINKGKKYNDTNTRIIVVPTGSGAKFISNVHEWYVNNVELYKTPLSNPNFKSKSRDYVIQKSSKSDDGTNLVAYYAGKFYRSLFAGNSNIDSALDEETDPTKLKHSPIVGWAYDGNPIYGPYAQENAVPVDGVSGPIKRMQSSYKLDPISDSTLRPSKASGFFDQDYVYNMGSGDLDEYNGRFCETPEFQEGRYVYFSTMDQSSEIPSYPYITKKHYNATDTFNYDFFKDQSDKNINTGEYNRMVTHLGINDKFRDYPFLSKFAKSSPKVVVKTTTGSRITGIDILERGHDYKVNEKINFTTDEINAQVKEIRGKKVETITVTETENNGLNLSVLDGKVTAISTVPHTYSNGDVIEISGVSTGTYKNIEGFYKVGVASVTSVLTTAIGATSVTGIVTAINLFDGPSKGKFGVGDIIGIGTERMKIIFIDRINNNYRVSRKENGAESAHSASSTVHREEYNFDFEVDKKLNGVNFEVGTTKHFSPEESVGVGSQYSAVIVGTAGSFNITKSVPPRAIYIRNHPFRSGDELEYVSYGGSITASHLQGAVGIGTNDASNFARFKLSDYSNLFAVNLGTDFLGVATSRVGVATNYLHFVSVDGKNAKFTKKVNRITADTKRRNATVMTGLAHGLIPGDTITLDVTPSVTDEVVFRYNENMRKLIVDPINVDVTGVSTTGITTDITSAITIEDHDFNTGDAVSYVAGSTIIGSLPTNGRIYYAIKYSNDKIRLAENYSSATSYPAQHINFPSVAGSGTFQLAKVDPKIVVTKGTQVSIAVSDTTLANYDINFYTDRNYKSRYESKLIERKKKPGAADAVVNVSIADSLPKVLYYKVEGSSANVYKTKDIFTVGESSIVVQDSLYNGKYNIIGSATTTFTFNLKNKVESASYNQSGLATALYSTNASGAIGGIHSLDIFDYGNNIKTLPVVTSVGTTTGYGAEFVVESDGIGTILDTEIKFSGIEIPEDKTLTPKAKSQILLSLEDNLTLSEVGVTSGGKNYNSAPKVIVPGHPEATFDVKVLGNAVVSVDVIFGSSGLSLDSKVVAINNTNGFSVTGAVSIGSTQNRISIKAPANTGFTTSNPFPFEVGDNVFVENIAILSGTGQGYNSSDYAYRSFPIIGINTTSGAESITYSIIGIAQSGGVFDASNNFGRVIKSEDIPTLTPTFKKAIYKKGEKITNQSGASATVVEFNESNDTLKIIDVNGEFERNDLIKGNASNLKASVSSLVDYDFDLKVSSTFEDIKTWRNDIGKLNNTDQRLHDNDFYQRFSYAIRGPVPYETWNEPVNSLAHVSGYKNFAEYEISNIAIPSVGMTTIKSDLALNLVLLNEASVHELFFYDFVTEDTTNPNFSKIVKFKNKKLIDSNESVTNKVLMIDDISPQFTGFTTSTGGGIVGLSTFTLLNESNTMLNHVFDPATAIDTTTDIITINDHNFYTGERLIYTQDSGPIGIAATHSIGIGINTTVQLPNEVYVVKITDNTFKLSMGSSESKLSTPHTIGFSTITGIGTEHSLAVESELAITRGLITIDNMIQSPIARKNVTVGLSSAIGSAHAEIYVNDPTKFVGNSLLKVDDEIFKVSSVGVGSTNSLSVERGFMGTSPAAHLVGAALTVLSGDYRIQKGKIHFKDAPYDSSVFSGRIFYRLDYSSNKIVDDISEEFDGTKDTFDLTVNTQDATGINTSFGAFLINNIFQRPFYNDVGSLLQSDYTLIGGSVGAASTIEFTGSLPDDLPKGGIINEVAGITTTGVGYQVPRAGSASTVFINGSGAVTAVGIGSSGGGAGYLVPPRVSIASTTGVGASITAVVTDGAITSFNVVAAGSGYTATSPPTVIITPPGPYKNLPLTGGNGSGATLDVTVGVGGSILDFQLAENGIGYEVDDVLELTGLEFQSVGVTTFPLKVTVASKYQDKFAGWTFGQLLELDDFSSEFNGFRKDFNITRTQINKEFYSIVAEAGSGIILQNNLLMFINDVLQKPDIDYTFSGGTKITFITAPDAGSKFKLYFYTGSDADYRTNDVDQTIKIGDVLRLQKWVDGVPPQNNRTVHEIVAADTVETNIYAGVGIVTNSNFVRPTMWRKQTSDLIIDGSPISKARDYLEPAIFPNTNIIAGVAATDTKMWVKDAWSFTRTDDLGGIFDDILIVGVGTTGNAITETINGVTFEGDYNLITGIGASNTGINTTTPMLYFDVVVDPVIFANPATPSKITISGISTGDYFVVDKTLIGSGVTSILDSPLNDPVGESTDYINGVYYAHKVDELNTTTARIYSNVQSLSGISTAGLSTHSTSHGCMSWGSMSFARNAGVAKTFTAQTSNGNSGLSTSTYVRRQTQYRLAY